MSGISRDTIEYARELNTLRERVAVLERVSRSQFPPSQGGSISGSSSPVTSTDHGGLGGLSDNDHDQYKTMQNILTPTPTYSSVQDIITTMLSAGLVSGGIISDAGSETINVAAGTGMIKSSDSNTADLFTFDWAAEAGLAIPTNTSRYIGIEYNAGVPQVLITATLSDFNGHDKIQLGEVVNEATVLHIQNIPHQSGDGIGHIIDRFQETSDPERGSGIILGESGDANRYVTVTAGTIFNLITKHNIAAFDSSGADRFDIYYVAVAGFTKVANQQSWDMDSYDDGSFTLQTMTNNRYAVLWFYMEFDGDLVAQYGRGQYVTHALAENEAVPSSAPDRINEHAILIGRLIFKKDTTPSIEVESTFTTVFSGLGVTDHDDLSNVLTDQHHTATVSGDIDHDATVNYAADQHVVLPNTFANVISDLVSHSEQVKAGFILHGGGTITVAADYRVGWDQRFIVIDGGRGTHFSTSGFFDITQPTSGVITAVGGGNANTWNANGIVIENWQALYYILPIGSGQASIAANFRMVGYTSDLEIPDDWIFIAGKNADAGDLHVKLGVGLILLASETWIQGTTSMIGGAGAIAHADLTDTNMTGAQLEDITEFGSGNKTYYPCIAGINDTTGMFGYLSNGGFITNKLAQNGYLGFWANISLDKNSLSFKLTAVRVTVASVNGTNYISEVEIWLLDSTPVEYTTGHTDKSTNRTTVGTHNYAITE
ncbi:hypothetical protein LCGC14_1676100, partial [marine sediment metagenome]